MAQSSVNPEVSVVMPCLNESATIDACIRKAEECFRRHNILGEVIVCDNGSTDRSANIAASLGAIVVRETEQGYGSALRRGIAAARGAYIVIGDADDSYDFGELNRFVDELKRGCDLVTGTRLKGTILPGAMPALHRYFGVPALTFMLNMLFGTRISDGHCGLRAFKKTTWSKLELRSTGMEFASEIIIQAKLQKLRITEIPITYYPTVKSRRSHLRSFRDGLRHVRLICGRFMERFSGK